MVKINKAKDKGLALKSLVGSLIINKSIADFKSLTRHNEEIEALGTVSANGIKAKSQNLQIDAVLFDELVPDAGFAAVLNEEMEVQVDNDIYKVTPYGTFIAEADKITEVNQILENGYTTTMETEIGEYLYRVDDGIMRYDTYLEAEDNLIPVDRFYPIDPTPTYPTPAPAVNCETGAVNPSVTANRYLAESIYCTFPTKAYGAKTIAGELLEGLFGANSDHDVDFDSDHRVKVKFYNFNYFVYSSIGIKVKFQKQGWTGIWDKRDTDKLLIGWDGIVFSTPFKYSSPYPVPSMPTGKIATELYKFANFDVVANTVTDFDLSLFGMVDNSDISKLLKNAGKSGIKKLTKGVWDYLETNLTPQQKAYRIAQTQAYRRIYNDSYTTAMSRYDLVKSNDGEFDIQFDFNVLVTFTSSMDGSGFDPVKNVLQPSASNPSTSYKVEAASIYGAALYNGKWKGVRIIQEGSEK